MEEQEDAHFYSMQNNKKGLDKCWSYLRFLLFLCPLPIKSITLTKNEYDMHSFSVNNFKFSQKTEYK
ncbi:hypothetical protein COL23_27450 [Priestia aryabhattai]|nr:hypothetical protein COL23_27450 [Priestia aryabhattai]